VSKRVAELARTLPIATILPALVEAAAARDLVIEAPPGAGKTTIVPLALLDADARQVLVLQPRRLAARTCAVRVARSIGEEVGQQVGYRVRFDRAGSRTTRLWFLTEGVLLRRLRDDPALDGVDTVVLDEFHERHLDGDLALALLRRVQRARPADRPLRLVVMSATLEADPVVAFLGATRLRAEGRAFPVELRYRAKRSRLARGDEPLEAKVAAALRELVDEGRIGGGRRDHVLVFLPGAREIRACTSRCTSLAEAAGLQLLPLHAQLSRADQDRAVFGRHTEGGRIILSTNVAESAITIEGVVAVVDSGLARVADFDPGSGLPRLRLAPISRASATQRAGRAGRTGPGVCIRLYSRHDHDTRPSHELAEIQRLDLAGPLLELGAAGLELRGEGIDFEWFEAPPEANLAHAREVLRRLEAIDEAGRLTPTGREMLRYPQHPRLARLIVAGVERGIGELAASAAAALAERSLRARDAPPPRTTDADLLDEIELLEGRGSARLADPAALARARRSRAQLARLLPKGQSRTRGRQSRSRRRDPEAEGLLRQAILAAHPDRVARVRADEHARRTLVFAFGGSAELSERSGVRSSEWVVALRSEERREGTRRRALVHSASAIDPDWLVDMYTDEIDDELEIEFDPARERVLARSALRYGRLSIESTRLPELPPEATAVLLAAARAAGAERFCKRAKDPDALAQLRLRAAFLDTHLAEGFPQIDEALVDATLEALCTGRSSFAELEQAGLLATLEAELGSRAGDRRALERLAPRQIRLPGGRRLAVHYEPDRPPWVGSRLQDFYGMAEGPRILDGREPLVLHLRAPNRHDVAVTTDLRHFWTEHYPELRRRLSRRYPKHAWPEDPLRASPPTRRRRR
jgi:ATP-dependent helicase HrpB